MKMKMKLAIAIVTMIVTTGTVSAVPIPIVNHSFEVNDIADGTHLNVAPPGWSVAGPGGSYLDRNADPFMTVLDPTPDTDGEQMAWSNGGDFYQVLGTNLMPNTTYTLTVDVGDRTDHDAPADSIRLGTGATFGANLLAATVVSNTTPFNGPGANDGWELWQSTFTTGNVVIEDALRVELVGNGVQAIWDNVRLDAETINPVPEPATATIAMLGLGGLMMRRRRSAA